MKESLDSAKCGSLKIDRCQLDTVKPKMRPPRVEYSLTDLGETITDPLEAIRIRTEQLLPDVRRARTRFAENDGAADR